MRIKLKTEKLKLKSFGFTLIELLIAMVIMGILATVGLGSFRISQIRGRDAERKSDLKQISNALELYYSDYRRYPDTFSFSGEFTDTKTLYMRVVPDDPGGCNYVYEVSTSGNKYRLFAHLENTEDKNIDPSIVGVDCLTSLCSCNFSITSANTTPTETW